MPRFVGKPPRLGGHSLPNASFCQEAPAIGWSSSRRNALRGDDGTQSSGKRVNRGLVAGRRARVPGRRVGLSPGLVPNEGRFASVSAVAGTRYPTSGVLCHARRLSERHVLSSAGSPRPEGLFRNEAREERRPTGVAGERAVSEGAPRPPARAAGLQAPCPTRPELRRAPPEVPVRLARVHPRGELRPEHAAQGLPHRQQNR